MITKHDSIVKLIQKLTDVSVLKKAYIRDFWEGDLCAIGIRNEEKLAYISTYKYVDDCVELYDYEFELLGVNEQRLKVVERGSSVDWNTLNYRVNSFLFA